MLFEGAPQARAVPGMREARSCAELCSAAALLGAEGVESRC